MAQNPRSGLALLRSQKSIDLKSSRSVHCMASPGDRLVGEVRSWAGGGGEAGSHCWLLFELSSIELPLLKKKPSENRPCEATRNLHPNKRVHHDHDREISSCGEGEGRMWVFRALRRKPEHHLAARLWGPQALRWLRLCQADL